MAGATKPVLVLNGPNLNMLGIRQPEIYGKASLEDAEALCRKTAAEHGLTADCRQINHIGKMIDWVQEARETHAAIIVNAGGYSDSVALLDALILSELPIIEVHVTNIHAREAFRRSLLSAAAKAVICGCGIDGYAYAMQTAAKLLR